LTNLKSLTLQDCGLNDIAIAGLPSLPALTTLDLRYNGINTVPSAVAADPKLSSLLLYGNPLNGNGSQTWYQALAGMLLTVDIAPAKPESVVATINPTNPTATYTGLATAFYDLPLEIYQYVVDTIQYQPYAGEMKGPLAVLETGEGNDWDTAALLATIYQQVPHISNITYYTGTIKVPMQQAENYVGATNPDAAYNILKDAGQNPQWIMQNGQWDLEFTHAWLQVQVATPGGAVTVPLDPSWKFRDFRAGIPGRPNMLSLVPFNSGNYLSQVRDESAAEYYVGAVQTYLASNYPGLTIADVPYTGPIHPQVFLTSPTALPYTAVTQASRDPASEQYSAEITVTSPNSRLKIIDYTFTLSDTLSDRCLDRWTISPNLSGTTAYTQLLDNGNPVATFSIGLPNASSIPLYLTIKVTPPSGGNEVDNTSDPSGCNALDFPYQPENTCIDVRAREGSGEPIDDNHGYDYQRESLGGYTGSSLEGLTWEQLTNIDSFTTVEAFQLANHVLC